MGRIYIAVATAAAAVLTAATAAADSWAEPQEENYYSANDAYYLHVVPGDGLTPARGAYTNTD